MEILDFVKFFVAFIVGILIGKLGWGIMDKKLYRTIRKIIKY